MERRAVERKEFTRSFDFKANSFGPAPVFVRSIGRDISSHGLGMMTEYRLEKGAVLRVILPEYWDGTTIPVFAEVAWTRPLGAGFSAGLRFL
jgi:hypothetical protein